MTPEEWAKVGVKIEIIGDLEAAMRLVAEIPPTTFRCAICGRATTRRITPDGEVGKTRGPADSLIGECDDHGELKAPTIREWYDEWVRHGKPDPFTIRLTPVQ